MSVIHDVASALAYGESLLRGERVRLVPVEEEHLVELARWWQRSDWAVLQQATVLPRPTAAVVEQLRSWSANADPSSVGFAVLDGDTLVGHVTLWGISPVTRVGTYAIVVGPEHVGKGYGTEATRVMLRYAFRELGLRKVELRAWAFNEGALRTYERCGFVREGVRRAVVLHAGRFHDEVLMGILAEELED